MIEKDIVTIYNNDILSRIALVDSGVTKVGQGLPVPVAIILIRWASYFESSL